MATEKFFVFNEAGTLKRLKGRIVRFLDGEDPDNDDKVAIRASLSVPASAEGLTPANNLSDVSSAATSRDNLQVPSDDEFAQAICSRLVGPRMYLNGTTNYLQVADSDALSFVDDANDLPFSVSALIKATDLTSFPIVAKYGTSAGVREWRFGVDGSDKLILMVIGTDGFSAYAITNTALTTLENDWIHVCATYGGSGPTSMSGTGFAAAASEINLYVNGQAKAVTAFNDVGGVYSGMSNTTQALQIGRFDNSYKEGFFKDIKIYNRELDAGEVYDLFLTGSVATEYKEQFGEGTGGTYTSDYSAGVDGLVATAGTVTGNIDAVGPGGDQRNDCARFTPNTTNTQHYIAKSGMTVGLRYRISFDYHISSANSNIDGVRAGFNGDNDAFGSHTSPTLNVWNKFTGEAVAITDTIIIMTQDGGNTNYADAGGDDTIEFRNVTFTQLGLIADFRASDFNVSADKMLDRSQNNFVATNNGATLLGERRHLSASTIDLSGLPTSATGLSAGEVWSNAGVLTIVT